MRHDRPPIAVDLKNPQLKIRPASQRGLKVLTSCLTIGLLSCSPVEDGDDSEPSTPTPNMTETPFPNDTPTPGPETPPPLTPIGDDDDSPAVTPVVNPDQDGDGWNNCEWTAENEICDCDDQSSDTYPGAKEICDRHDNDCDGKEDEWVEVETDEADGTPFDSIQEAIDSAEDGQTILVHCTTTYYGSLTIRGRSLAVRSEAGAGDCIIQADAATPALRITQGSSLLLEGFTLTGGDGMTGGGIYIDGSSVTLTNLIIKSNVAELGGGAYMLGAQTSFVNVTLEENEASIGAGIYADQSELELVNTILEKNDATDGYGGGIQLSHGSSATLHNVALKGNLSSWGGAVNVDESDLELENAIISDNSAINGGGLSASSATLRLRNVTAAYNTSFGFGGGLYLEDSEIILESSILAFNEANHESANLYLVGGDLEGGYNCVFTGSDDGLFGTETSAFYYLVEDPLLQEGSVHLQAGSPAVDKGVPDADAVDPDASRNDMGAFGGPNAAFWDLDRDGYYDYYWPGTWDAPPPGVDSSSFDCDDTDAGRHPDSGC